MTESLTEQTSLQQIQTGLQVFESRREEIFVLAETTKGINLNDWRDRSSLKAIADKRKELKAARIQVQKEGKSMRDLITPISKHIKSKEDELVAIIEPCETRLQGMEDWAEQESEKERQAAIAAENTRIQNRIDALAIYGYQIDYADIKAMSDETFDNYLKAARIQHEKEEADKAEVLRLKQEQEESERVAAEQERKRMDDERVELQKLREQQAEAQRIIDDQNRKNEDERLKIEEEKLAIEAAKQKAADDKRHAEELKQAQEIAAGKALQKAAEDAKEAERLASERKEKERVASERKAARQPDKVKIQKYIADVKAIAIPELKTEEAQAVMSSIQELITRLDAYASEKTEAL